MVATLTAAAALLAALPSGLLILLTGILLTRLLLIGLVLTALLVALILVLIGHGVSPEFLLRGNFPHGTINELRNWFRTAGSISRSCSGLGNGLVIICRPEPSRSPVYR